MDLSYDSSASLQSATALTASFYNFGVVDVSWSIPTGLWNEQVLVRSTVGYVNDLDEGDVIVDEAGGLTVQFYQDSSLPRGVPFVYYTLLLFSVTQQEWVIAGTATVAVVTDYGYTDLLYARLPAVFKSPDLESVGSGATTTDTSLYRFLSLFGIEYDFIRSMYDSLLLLRDPERVLASFLPAALSDFNISFEPELGALAMRRWLANAVRLIKYKGTPTSVEEVTTILSGWRAVVLTGKNLALDDPSASQTGGVGLWGSTSINASVTYLSNNSVVSGVVGTGVVQARVNGYNSYVRVGLYDYTDDPLTQRLQGIPITQGLTYCASMYFQASGPGVRVVMRIIWTDVSGAILGSEVISDPSVLLSRTTMRRVSVTGVAPITAAFALVDWEATSDTGFIVNDLIYSNGFQFEEGFVPTSFECARMTHVVVTADAVNWVVNPTATNDASGWIGQGTIARVVDDSGITYFDLAVDPTTGVPGLPAYGSVAYGQGPYGILENTVTACSDSSRHSVMIGETWTAQVQVRDSDARSNPIWCAAVLRLYYRGTYIRSVLASWSSIVDNVWTTSTVGYSVTQDEAVTEVEPGVIFRYMDGTEFAGDEDVYYRRALLEDTTNSPAVYVDGSIPSNTSDYIWGGPVGLSPSYYYKNRSLKASRLNDILTEYLPFGACFDIVFAHQDIDVHGGGLAIENYNLNDIGNIPQFAVVEAVTELVWDVTEAVGLSLEVDWQYEPDLVTRWAVRNTVGVSLDVEWKYISGNSISVEWKDIVAAGQNLAVAWNDQQTVTITDTFARADGAMGSAPGGSTYTVLQGGATISSGKADVTTNGAESGRSIAALVLAGDGVFTATFAPAEGGECLYFRVSANNNWWRVRRYYYTTYYQSGYTCSYTDYDSGGNVTGSGSYQSGTDQSGSTSGSYVSEYYCSTAIYQNNAYTGTTSPYTSSSDVSGYSGDVSSGNYGYTTCSPVENYYTAQTTSCSPNYSSSTSVAFYLEKCINGTITSTALTGLTDTGTLRATCAGSSITISDGTHSTKATTDVFNQTATMVGIGSGPSDNYSNPLYFTSFTATYSEV